MSLYTQGSKRKAMRKASRPGPCHDKQGTHWVKPSERENEAGQKRVRCADKMLAQRIEEGE